MFRKNILAKYNLTKEKKRIGHVVGNFMICSGTLGYLPWCFFERTFRQYLVQRIEVQKKKVRKSRFLRNETFRKPFDFFKTTILGELYFGGNLRGSLVKIFAEKVARGNSVQIGLNFPAKSLSIYTNFFLDAFLII